MKQLLVVLPLVLTGCATTSGPPAPRQPILSCDDCAGLVYYGQQQAYTSDSVKMLGILAGAATSIAGYGFASNTVKGLTETAANAGKIEVINQPDPTVVRPEVILVPSSGEVVSE